MKKMIDWLKSKFSNSDTNSNKFLAEQVVQAREETRAAEATLSDVYWRNEELNQENKLLMECIHKIAEMVAVNPSGWDAKALYEAIAPSVDPVGAVLLKEGTAIFGQFNWDAHVEESYCGKYDYILERNLFDYLLEDAKALDGQDSDFPEKENQVYVNVLVKAGVLGEGYYKTFPAKVLPLRCSDMFSDEQIKEIYLKNYKRLDGGGFTLLAEAEALLGKLDPWAFSYENAMGTFECADGFKLLRYLKVQYCAELGDPCSHKSRWSVVPGTCYERCHDLSVDESTEQYRAFEEKLYRNTCRKLGLLVDRAELENELEIREQHRRNEEVKTEGNVSRLLEPYTDNQIGAALRGCW